MGEEQVHQAFPRQCMHVLLAGNLQSGKRQCTFTFMMKWYGKRTEKTT